MKIILKVIGIVVAVVILIVAAEFFIGGITFPVPYPLNAKTVALVQSATSVETFRVELPMIDDTTPEGDKEMEKLAPYDYYQVTKIGPVEAGDYLRQLQSLLMSRQSFYHDDTKCILDPGTILRLKSPQGYVDIVQCFHCNEMVVACHVPKGHGYTDWYGQIGNRSAFLKLVKEAFPNDPEIKAL